MSMFPVGEGQEDFEREDGYLCCGRCGRLVVDDTTDFGNGLMLRTTAQGVEFRVLRQQGEMVGQDWTPGISRDELLSFLRGWKHPQGAGR